MREYRSLSVVCLFAVVCQLGWAKPNSQSCPAAGPRELLRLSQYVAEQYQLAPDVRAKDKGSISGTCIRRIEFTSMSPHRSFLLYLYDDRFLLSDLMDTTVDPAQFRVMEARTIASELNNASSPVRGSVNAPVTIVVFSDFECPYCRHFERELKELPSKIAQEVRVEFKEMPLPMHPWASSAAQAAVCASFQGEGLFWQLHDFLFANQPEVTAQNLKLRIRQFSSDNGKLDFQKLDHCMGGERAGRVLLRDRKLATRFKVTATPTTFINGMRKGPFATFMDLTVAVEEALSDVQRERGEGIGH